MFVSITKIDPIDYNHGPHSYLSRYKVVDSEFEDVITTNEELNRTSVMVDIIIYVYEKRNLPVSANIIKLFLFLGKQYRIDVMQLIEWSKQYGSKYNKYEKDVEKLMVLM